MKYEIFYFGNIKTNFIKEGINQYLLWNSKYINIKLNSFQLTKNMKKIPDEEYKLKDYEKYKKHLNTNSYNIILDENGKNTNSIQFSKIIDNIKHLNKNSINFFIGGALGHSKKIYSHADYKLSLSKLTFTHEMAVLLLLEQIFRANKILNNETYHY